MAVAYPFVKVNLDASGLTPIATRSPGVVAIVGVSDKGTAAAKMPTVVDGPAEAATAFGDDTPLGRSLNVALKQQPSPSKVYGLKIAADDEASWKEALDILSGVKDVTFVAAAEKPIGAGGGFDPVLLVKKHCEDNAADGQPRIAVAEVNPATGRSPTYVGDITGLLAPYVSDRGRLVLVAARGAKYDDGKDADVAAAAVGAIAGRAPETSIVLKVVSGFKIADDQKYGPSEIKGLAEAKVVPIIDPILIPGESLHFADGTSLASEDAFKYVDTVRLLDDIDFALKASLVGLIGDARITRTGLNTVRRQLEAVLDEYVSRQAITGYQVVIDLLPILDRPESSWSDGERLAVRKARGERLVTSTAVVVIGPAIHQLVINLQPTFVAAA